MKVFIIGSGNVAWHLAKAFSLNNIHLSGLYSRNQEEGNRIAKKLDMPYFSQLSKIPRNGDVYIICISDDAIKNVVQQLPKSIKNSKIIAHTSGSKSIAEALPECKKGGVFYPLQTFTKGVKMGYDKIPFCIHGTNKKIKAQLFDLGSMISSSVQYINDDQRKQIHLSAVFINNFVNHLIFAAEDLLEQNEISPKILQPLLKETIRKQKSNGALSAQTGPAKRKDRKTLEAHLDLLKPFKNYKSIYTAISKSIQNKYNQE